MFLKYLIQSKPLNQLNQNVCNRCLSWFLKTKSKRSLPTDVFAETPKGKRSVEQYLYIKDSKTAETVVRHLSDDLPNDKSVIFESSPGISVLTNQLLRSGAQLVRVFEENPLFLEDLKKLRNQFPNRLQIIEKQLTNYRNFLYKYYDSYELVANDIFEGIGVRDWRSEPVIKLVAVLSPRNSYEFLRFLIRQLVKKDLFFNSGRTEFLVFVSETEYKYMTASPESKFRIYRAVSVLYQTLFDIQALETVAYNEFALYPNSSTKKLEGNAVLVRLTPKLYLDDYESRTLKEYYYFVTQTFAKRKHYIIPFLENWFPDCGPDLIKRGIPVFKYFGHLRAEEVLDLFNYLQNRSDYKNSIYESLVTSDELSPELNESPDVKADEEDIDCKDKEELSDNE